MDAIDTADTQPMPRVEKGASPLRLRVWRTISSWLLMWEIYPIICIAIFLRFYQVGTTEFDADQATIFGMAHDALAHGLIPVTTNVASIGIMNPPATVYLLMLGAIFSANPLASIIVTGLLNVLAVVFTYAVVCRYYGRFAATTVALLYAVAELVVYYSRFPWNQNLLAPFVPLFLFALLWGVVERRRGWLTPAVLLWGWMIQLHGSAVFLIIPLLLACVLAFKTLRWRDVFLALGLLFLIYLPYVAWEVVTHFADVSILLQSLHNKSMLDSQALYLYLEFLNPALRMPTNLLAWQTRIGGLLHRGYQVTVVLTVCAFLFACGAVCVKSWKLLSFVPRGAQLPLATATFPATFWGRMRLWFAELIATPWRCGLLVLLAWQILPLLALSRHSLPIYNYYLLVLMPGPFILIGILAAQVRIWLSSGLSVPWRLARYALVLVLAALILLQAAGTFTWISDEAYGQHGHGLTYNTLQDMQNALNQTDQVAQTRGIHHIYIYTDEYTQVALTYLAGQLHTPYTVVGDGGCLLLPGASNGPALVLLGPADTFSGTLLSMEKPQLLLEPARLGSSVPYRLYLFHPAQVLQESTTTFVHHLTFQSRRLTDVSSTAAPVLLTGWSVDRAAQAAYDTAYSYDLKVDYPGGFSASTTCTMSSLQPGEQLLVTFALPRGSTALPGSLTFSGQTWHSAPYDPSLGPLHLETLRQLTSPKVSLQSGTGGNAIIVS